MNFIYNYYLNFVKVFLKKAFYCTVCESPEMLNANAKLNF